MEGCPLPDGDCPAGGRFKDSCAEAVDCDSRVCAPAPDEPRIEFCSEPCNADNERRVCSQEMVCQDEVCVFRAPTPGAQGSPCANGDDCRSGHP